ncbi:MAG: 1,4-dihydroxy-2-naphthoate polyprenyltransferase [Candidatus Zixiibacteriota bacterium]
MARSSWHTWLLAARPKTLPAAAAPVIIGTAMAHTGGGAHWPSALAAMTGALLIQVGTNFANDYFDYKKGTDSGERLGPVRVTQAGLVSPEAMKRATILVFALAVLVGVYLVWRGGVPIVVIGLLSVLFGVLYTGGPYPLGYNGLGELFVLIFFGPVAVGGTYYVQTIDINLAVIVAGFAPGLFSVGILTVNNLRDIDNDRVSGKRTLAVRFGRRFALHEYYWSLFAACTVPLVLALLFHGPPLAILASLTVVPSVIAMGKVATVTGRDLNDCLAVTGRLLLVYSAVFSLGWIL